MTVVSPDSSHLMLGCSAPYHGAQGILHSLREIEIVKGIQHIFILPELM